jgi:hypothetical protein
MLMVLQKEDLEFSVGSKQAVWEVKDPLLASSSGLDYDYQEDSSSNLHSGFQPGGYGGSHTASLVGGVSGQQYYGGQSKGGQGGGGRGYPPNSERY